MLVDMVARRNVSRVVESFCTESHTLESLVRNKRVAIVGAVYDVVTGALEVLPSDTQAIETTAGSRVVSQ